MENIALKNLMCEYLSNPIGIDIKKPRLFWQIESCNRNVFQQAYWIQVSTSEDSFQSELYIIWDTDWVESDKNIHVEYKGPDLMPRTRYFWRVKVRDTQGNESEWS